MTPGDRLPRKIALRHGSGAGWVVLAALAFIAAGFAPAGALAETPSRPNIIVILADDLGHGDLGVTGASLIRTPHLDRLAAEGALLTRFFASANVCTPSRAGLLTGRYAARAGLARSVIFPYSEYGLPAEEVTLAEALKAQGYSTHMVGKWHLGTTAGSRPLDQGFDTFVGVPYSNDMSPLPLLDGERTLDPAPAQDQLTELFTGAAEAAIARAAGEGRPFFLYFAHTAPHLPLDAHPDFDGRSRAGVYGDVVEEVDASVGRVRAAVEKAGAAANTVILFTSDNGPWFEGAAGPFRGRKGGTHEGAYAAPLIAWAPGRIPAGARSEAMAMNIDLFPTLLAMAGGAPPADRPIDGRDIAALLAGGRESPHQALFFFANNRIAAVRTAGWRYVLRDYYLTFEVDLEARNGSLLVDLAADPEEAYDVSDRRPDVVAIMRGWVEHARRTFEALPQGYTPPPAPASR